jgi:hypothetical protein
MLHQYRSGLALSLAGLALALSGCAMMDGSGTTQASSSATAMGSGGSGGFMRASLDPFSLSNCLKFEALPHECEAVVQRGGH